MTTLTPPATAVPLHPFLIALGLGELPGAIQALYDGLPQSHGVERDELIVELDAALSAVGYEPVLQVSVVVINLVELLTDQPDKLSKIILDAAHRYNHAESMQIAKETVDIELGRMTDQLEAMQAYTMHTCGTGRAIFSPIKLEEFANNYRYTKESLGDDGSYQIVLANREDNARNETGSAA